MIGDALRQDGLDVDVQPAGKVRHVEPYDAVVIGGALYIGRWHRDARRFARRQARQAGVAVQHAKEHKTFGGKLTENTDSWLARRLAANGRGGDFRNPERITAWAHQIALSQNPARHPAAA